MNLTERKIRQLSINEYHEYRKDIKEFYKSQRMVLEALKASIKLIRQKKRAKTWLGCKIQSVYWGIHSRCNNSNTDNYYRYGGRGIKNNITQEELKELWIRDKAHLLSKPSIDRVDNDGNYEYSNCQFIEMSDNVKKRHKK